MPFEFECFFLLQIRDVHRGWTSAAAAMDISASNWCENVSKSNDKFKRILPLARISSYNKIILIIRERNEWVIYYILCYNTRIITDKSLFSSDSF